MQVRIYVEAGCPYCRQYLNGPLKHALEDEDVSPLIEVDISPFGNAYFLTEQCLSGDGALHFHNRAVAASHGQYDVGTRECFDSECGFDAESHPGECFLGELVCQHGPRECSFNRYMACAKRVLPSASAVAPSYVLFFTCMENHFRNSTDDSPSDEVLSVCAASAGVPRAELDECYHGADGDAAIAEEAAATPTHSGVPWVTIDGRRHITSWDEGYELEELVRAVREAQNPHRQLRSVSASGVLAAEAGTPARDKERMC